MEANARHTLELFREASADGASVVVFPELGLSGYTARDLFLDHHLLERCEHALARMVEASEGLAPMAVVGMPLRVGDGLYNAAVALQRGQVLGVVPKAYLPNYGEFEEARWFRPGAQVSDGSSARVLGVQVPMGLDLLFEADGDRNLTVGLEICEDNWVPVPPSSLQVAAGATVIANLSASNFTIGKAELRRELANSSSMRGACAYLYVAAGPGESSTDLAFDADAFICEHGAVLAQSRRFSRESQLVSADLDLELLARERMRTSTFGDCAAVHRRAFRRIPFASARPVAALRRHVDPHPFVPSDPATLGTRCWEIFEIQSNALATRMRALGRPKLVLGVSGGLDSTMAALVAAAALDLEGQPRSDLICATMPGLGTTRGTRDNAERLAAALGATFREVPVSEASRLVLGAVEHPAAAGAADVEALVARLREDAALADVAVENVQARLRTLLLMTLANQCGGLVVGTGDLSEKALGWSTYAGDHIAMYDVNASVPKTLIRFVIRWVANERASTWGDTEAVRAVLFDILDTPISPELLPADESGAIAQLTEEAIGPFELHDFFLFHLVRHGARPGRILDLARVAFAERYALAELKQWLAVFYRRFFGNQFKRSCTADAPKVGLVALSPRGDWRMPSDAVVRSWLDEIDRYRDQGDTQAEARGA
jgi:NAD+ synthase (glutamine-hydrolysing)